MEITESNKPRSLTFLLSTLALCMPVLAQQGASAGVYGSVLDSQGAVITGAKVTLLHVTTNQARTAVTNETGEFLFPLRPQLSLPNGTIGNRTFGRITSTTSGPRILQLSLKVEF